MKRLPLQRRSLALLAAVLPLLALFVYVALRSGPLAPVPVTVMTVQEEPVTPALFGIGAVEARYTYRIGPTAPGRLARLDVHVGDRVAAGQVLGEMDPVDLDQRLQALEAALRRAAAAQAEARARQTYAAEQALRYQRLQEQRLVSAEAAEARYQDQRVADAVLAAAGEELARAQADREALLAQRGNLRLVSPVDGLVALRAADPGTTLVAGQAVIEIIDIDSLWINTRFDQANAGGLAAGLDARVMLRSTSPQPIPGRVARVEPLADAVTEETLAKVTFEPGSAGLPPVGELAEVTVQLPPLPATPVIPNAAIRQQDGQRGVWRLAGKQLEFVPVRLGASNLDGRVQVLEGLTAGERVVLYSAGLLTSRSRLRVVADLPAGRR